MNIALLALIQEWGGCEVHAAGLTRTLLGRGHQATVHCLSQRTFDLYRTHAPDVPAVLDPIPERPEAMRWRHWRRFFAARPWDACLLIKGSFYVGSWQLDLAARRATGRYYTIEQLEAAPIPRTSRRHFGLLPGLGLWWRRELLRGRLRGLGPRLIVCVSDAVRRRLLSEFRLPARKLVVIHNGADTGRFRPDPALRAAFRSRWGYPDAALVFGAAGRFAPMKGYATALAGFQALLQRYPDRDLRLFLAGQGELDAALRRQADAITPSGRITVAPFSERPWEVFNGLDVFLMPSLTEGLPLALLEAMACGACPIAMAAGGIPEILTDPALGWLVPLGDEAAFGRAMEEAAALSRPERERIGLRARAHVQRHFDAARQYERLAELLEGSAGTLPAVF
jgi:glycosyltransferase involved in cell wall biosynthesis